MVCICDIEIECTSEESMLAMCRQLGFDPADSLSGTTDDVYHSMYHHAYGIDRTIFHGQGATFGFHNTGEMIGPHVNKNNDLFHQVVHD